MTELVVVVADCIGHRRVVDEKSRRLEREEVEVRSSN